MKKTWPLAVQLVFFIWLSFLHSALVQARAPWLTTTNAGPSTEKTNTPATDPPVFPEVPADITLECLYDALPAPALLVTDDTDPAFPMMIPAVDNPNPNTLDVCTGGTILRSWTATDMDGNSTTVTQMITVLPDDDPPIVLVDEVSDTVLCSSVTASSWNTWVNSQELTLATQIDECDIDRIDNDAPPTFDTYCGSITVTFTVVDECGAATDWHASYTVLDTVAPVLIGLPVANDTISCEDPVPPVPVVTASDNCTTNLTVNFQEDSGQVMDGSCAQYTYVILRTWSVVDSCGNLTTASHSIRVRDKRSPTFTRPPDLTISCSQNPNDLSVTGDVTDAVDNCDPNVEVGYTDEIEPGEDCDYSYVIKRIWRAEDACGNATGKIQLITVEDAESPSFTVPGDLDLDCGQSTDPAATGQPTEVSDNCDPAPAVTYSDLVIQGSCLNEVTIERTWNVSDACGNFTEKKQTIVVTDQAAPTFTAQASDLEVVCADNMDIDAAFIAWVGQRAGAVADDNCTLPEDLTWYIYNAGTTSPPNLPPLSCPSDNANVLRIQTVDFIAEDECGNRDTTTATFSLIDIDVPQMSQCPTDQVIATTAGQCEAAVTLQPPVMTDLCNTSRTPVNLSQSAPITSQAPPGQQGNIPVDPIEFELVIPHPLPVNAAGSATLTVSLFSAEAEGQTEFFRILGEDGTVLGQTAPTPSDVFCGDSEITLMVPAALLNSWLADGAVTIRLEPNVPPGMPGSFAINAICTPQGSASVDLSFEARNFDGLRYEYRLDDNPRILVDPVGPVDLMLPQGVHQVRYYVTDCAGQVDSCTFQVTVQDQEPPAISCPPDLTMSLPAGECLAEVELPFPGGVTDNCTVGQPFEVTLPADTAAARLTFALDPNLNEYLAQTKAYTFSGLLADADGPATLDLSFLGDFDDNFAFLEIYGDDGALLGTTTGGGGTCNTAGQRTFIIPQTTYNEWAADGSITITLQPGPINVPPNVPGDGINPCNPANVNGDGDDDGQSYAFVTLSGRTLQPFYFAEGASPIPLTSLSGQDGLPVHPFSVGETVVSYLISDSSDNQDTCSFTITVVDEEMPTARCLPTTLFINPGGTAQETIAAALIDDNSFDNCVIDTMFLTPATFDCTDAEELADVTLTVIDQSGNQDTCNTFVRVELDAPDPTSNADQGLCAGDTLFLQANPPPAPGGVVYTYAWSGPNLFSSNQANPFIPNVSVVNSGTYTVTITGITGCMVSGSTEVAVQGLPTTPTIATNLNICVDDDIELISNIVPSGQAVRYRWYEGIPPATDDNFLAETTDPFYTIPGPHSIPAGNDTRTVRYFLEIIRDGCFSETSPTVAITISRIPEAQVTDEQVVRCEGTSFIPGAVTVPGSGITYQWNGPNGYTFSAGNPNPPAVSPVLPVSGGAYELIVLRNGCASLPDTTLLTVIPKPPTPDIFNDGPACEGEDILLSTNATGVTSYIWQSSATIDTVVTTANSLLLPDLAESDEATWRVRVRQGACFSDYSVPTAVVVNPLPPTVASVMDNTVCEGDTIRLQASPNVPTYSYLWQGPAGFTSMQPNPRIGDNVGTNREGTYVLTVTTDAGCSRSANVFVDIVPGVSILGVSNDGGECQPGPEDLRLVSSVFPPDNGSYQYTWTPPSPGITVLPDPNCNGCAIVQDATEAENGIYSLVVMTGDGCVSDPDTTLVSITNPPPTPAAPQVSNATPPPFCEGEPITLVAEPYQGDEVIYYWRRPGTTQPYPDTVASLNLLSPTEEEDEGLYSLFVSVDGCLSAESPQISINIRPVPGATPASNGPLCVGDTLRLFSPLEPGVTYNWQGPPMFSSSLPLPVIPNAGPARAGFYSLSATLNGCTAEDSVLVVINPSPQQPVAVNDGPFCISQGTPELTLSVTPASATNGALYAWYDPGNVLLAETPDLDLVVGDLLNYGDGVFNFSVQAVLGDCLSDPVSTAVSLNAIPAGEADAGMDDSWCEVDELRFDAAAPALGSGLWTPVGGTLTGVTIADPANPQSPVSGLLGGETYAFAWTLSNGACQNYAADTVYLDIIPGEVPVAGEDIRACIADNITLNAQPTVTGMGLWSQPREQDSLGVVIVDPTDPNTPVTGLNPDNTYIFTWSVVSGCGSGDDDVLVIISDPTPNAGRDTIVCDDSGLVRLNADPPTLGSTGRWSSPDPELVINNPANPRSLVMDLAPGENVLVWTIDDAFCGSQSIDTVIITREIPPVAVDDQVIVPFGEGVEINVLANDEHSAGSTTDAITQPGFGTLEKVAEGRYLYRPDITFAGTDQFRYELCTEGCECSEAVVTLLVGQEAACKIPNVITPNGDNINDVFVVPCLLNTDLYPQSQVSIFNRWGDEVFRSGRPYENNWGGTFSGEDLPDGTYFYIVDYGDGSEPASGFVVIQR